MKIQTVLLDQIVPNPWRDMRLYPIDADHVRELRESIDDHGFFGGVKARRHNGKVELGCGHSRIEAARKARLDSVQIVIDDMDDDTMLRLMTDENATQAGANPGAVMNEVAAVTRRLIAGLGGTIVPPSIEKAFGGKHGVETARGALRKRFANPDAQLPASHNVIRAYLGDGKPERSHRGERQVREAISALKQSGRYDEIVDEELRKHPQPGADAPPAKEKTVTTRTQPKSKRRLLDERTANVFPNEHQFHAFREAITLPGAQKVIPVDKQFALAKEIMSTTNSQFSKKGAGAPYIKKMVQDKVQEGLKAQRDIDKAEKEAYLSEQREARIDSELSAANKNLRSLISALAKMADLADQFPAHPKITGFAARLDTLVGAIQAFSKKLK
jgi:hypothetical protein